MDRKGTNEEHIYILENGRGYYANEKIAYLLPPDLDETDRLIKQHYAFKASRQGNFFTPVQKQLEEGIMVLDSGCGPASWTLDMAKEFPKSKFYGVDISNFFPEETKPDNCEFIIGNITERLPYEDNTFDYIHQRLLLMGLTRENWDKCLKELLRVLKPNGYIEVSEKKMHNAGPLISNIHELIDKMMDFRGISANIALQLNERTSYLLLDHMYLSLNNRIIKRGSLFF